MSSFPLGAPSVAPHGLLKVRVICRALQVLGLCSYFCLVLKSSPISSLISPCGSTPILGLTTLAFKQTWISPFCYLLLWAIHSHSSFSHSHIKIPSILWSPTPPPLPRNPPLSFPLLSQEKVLAILSEAQHKLWVQTDLSLGPGPMPLRKVIYLFNYQFCVWN